MKIVLIIIAITILGVGGFVIYRNYTNQTPYSPAPLVTATPNPKSEVVITSPLANSIVKSPLIVRGTVPAGWMFEGSLPIKLLDDNKNLIVQGIAQEKVPGSWQSGDPIDFESEIKFTTTARSGFLVIEKDNPSGLPENAKSFSFEVLF